MQQNTCNKLHIKFVLAKAAGIGARCNASVSRNLLQGWKHNTTVSHDQLMQQGWHTAQSLTFCATGCKVETQSSSEKLHLCSIQRFALVNKPLKNVLNILTIQFQYSDRVETDLDGSCLIVTTYSMVHKLLYFKAKTIVHVIIFIQFLSKFKIYRIIRLILYCIILIYLFLVIFLHHHTINAIIFTHTFMWNFYVHYLTLGHWK